MGAWASLVTLPTLGVGLVVAWWAIRMRTSSRPTFRLRAGIVVVAALVLAGSQFMRPVDGQGAPSWWTDADIEAAGGLATVQTLRDLRAYALGPTTFASSQRVEPGVWVVPLSDAIRGTPLRRVLTDDPVPITGGVSYVTAVQAIDRGFDAPFAWTIVTDAGDTELLERTVEASVGVVTQRVVWRAPEGATTTRSVRFELPEGTPSPLTVVGLDLHPLEAGGQDVASAPVPRVPAAWQGAITWLGRIALLVVLVSVSRRMRGGEVGQVRCRRDAAVGLSVGLSLLAVLAGIEVMQGVPRAQVGAFHANALGHQAVALAGLAWLWARRGIPVWVAIASALGVVLASGSRTALIGMLVLLLGVVVLPLIVQGGRQARRRLAMSSLALLVMLAATLPAAWTLRGDAFLDLRNVRERTAIWGVAVQAIQAYPWTGLGVGVFEGYASDHRPASGWLREAGHAHNNALQILIEVGWLGFVAFLAILSAMVRGPIGRDGLAPSWLVGTLLVMNLVDVTLFWLPVWAAFALAWGSLGSSATEVTVEGSD